MGKKPAFDRTNSNWPAVSRLIDDYFERPMDVDVTVAADDDMFTYSIHICKAEPIGSMAYFRAGLNIYDFVAAVAGWRFGGIDKVQSFLDFASGHGRFTRYLAGVMPRERISAAEILSDAVQFQREQFRVNALQSTTVPEDFECDRKFDFIFVSSLFTHLPDATFVRWMRRLYELLTPEGILVFSVHGKNHLPPNEFIPESGIYFFPASEIPTLDVNDYGVTIVNKDYVRRAIRQATGKEEFHYLEDVLCFTHDIVILSKGKLPEKPLQYDQGPQGHVDICSWNGSRELWLKGWSACLCPQHTITDITIAINGEPCGNLKLNHDRPDVAKYLKYPDNPYLIRSGWDGVARPAKLIDPFRDVFSAIATCTGGKKYGLRTVMAYSLLQFPSEIKTPWNEQTLSPRDKLMNAVEYMVNGQYGMLSRKMADFLRGK
jgi:SAM-dependent methyltransferase